MGASCSAVRSVPPQKNKTKKSPRVFPPFIFNRHLIDRSPVVETAVEIDFSLSDAGKIRSREENKVTTESWWGRGGGGACWPLTFLCHADNKKNIQEKVRGAVISLLSASRSIHRGAKKQSKRKKPPPCWCPQEAHRHC